MGDCAKCKADHDEPQRRDMACGWLPIDPDTRGWIHEGQQPPHGVKFEDWRPVCPGYSCGLPEVIEVSRLHAHWRKGALREACDDKPTDAVLSSALILEGQQNSVESWAMTPRSKGGGRAD
jgi:hypothetical protein